MGVSAQGGNGEEGLQQFLWFVCLSDEWKSLWERTWVASSPFLCKKCKGGWQVLLSLFPAMPVRACECSWWIRSWEIACMTLSCLHQFEFIHVSESILFKIQLSLLCFGRLMKPLSIPNSALEWGLPPKCWSQKQANERKVLATCGNNAPSPSVGEEF